jgi:Bacteriophage probable baseplate hub protein
MSEVPTLVDPSLYDPWSGKNIDALQSSRLRAEVTIIVDGDDVTKKVDPHLIMVRTLTGTQTEEYQCEIELDDRDGRLSIPAIGVPLKVLMGWRGEGSAVVWDGTVHDVESGFGRRQGGRRLWIHGLGAEMIANGKSPRNDGEGEGGEDGPLIPLSKFLKRVAREAGHDLEVHSMFDGPKYQRRWWQQSGESYYHLAKRLAEEMGALFRVKQGTNGQFTVKGQNIDGTITPARVAEWGRNLIAWRVRPIETRTQWNEVSSHHFDVGKGMWNQVKQSAGAKAPFNMGQAGHQASQPAPNKGQAESGNQGTADGIESEKAPGRIVTNGDPDAQGNAYVQLIGARPGVDGIYWCSTVEQIYSRQGYVTWFDCNAVQVSAAIYQRYLQSGLTGATAGPVQPPGLNNVPGGGIVGAEPF